MFELGKLKNAEKGKRCFILATGPSTEKQDLTLLKDETVIGVSGLFNHKDINTVNPKYYVNPPVFAYHSHYHSEDKFISYLKDMDKNLSDDIVLFFHIGDKKYIDKYKIFINKKIVWNEYKQWDNKEITDLSLDSMPNISSVSESAIYIALYLGFKEIFLLGFDHDWFNGLYNYSFKVEKLQKHFKKSAQEVCEAHNIDSEFQMRRHAKIFHKYKILHSLKKNIYNANSNSSTYVDTFPKVEYTKLFDKEYEKYLLEINNDFYQFLPVEPVVVKPRSDIKLSNLEFSSKVSKYFLFLKELKGKFENIIVYGNGSGAKIAQMILGDNVKAILETDSKKIKYVDKGLSYHPSVLNTIEYDIIFISVLGRENTIKDYLINIIGLDNNLIVEYKE